MKIFICAVLMAILYSCSHSSSDGFIITGKMTGDYSGMVYLNFGEEILDSTLLKNGTFVFKGEVQKPTEASLDGEGVSAVNRNFFIENSKISVKIHSEIKRIEGFSVNWFDIDSVVGTTTANVESEIFHSLENNAVSYERTEEILGEYKEHPISGHFLSQLSNLKIFSKDTILNLLSGLDKEVITPHDLTRIYLYVNSHPQKGESFIDFSLPDMNNKVINTKELRKNKYLFIDFWASWCAPCREEFPELLSLKNQFEEKPILFLGVSLDKKVESWKKVILKDNLTWTNLVDTQAFDGEVARIYQISAIPSNLLVSPEGIILDINLTTEELEKKLDAVL